MSAAHKLDVVERRVCERFPANKTVLIHTGGGDAVSCTIENISEEGALLVLNKRVKLPARFELTSPEDRITLKCRRKRVSGSTVAVEFIRD